MFWIYSIPTKGTVYHAAGEPNLVSGVHCKEKARDFGIGDLDRPFTCRDWYWVLLSAHEIPPLLSQHRYLDGNRWGWSCARFCEFREFVDSRWRVYVEGQPWGRGYQIHRFQ
jgi:hypothetical protein